MFKKILLPLDLTDRHSAAINIAAEFARQNGGEVTLLHVIELIPGLPLEEEKNFYSRLERAARGHMERLGENLAQRGVAWREKVLFGTRAAEIARFAEEGKSDLIVLTAPRIDLSHPASGWGSISYKVGILAHSPVLLVK